MSKILLLQTGLKGWKNKGSLQLKNSEIYLKLNRFSSSKEDYKQLDIIYKQLIKLMKKYYILSSSKYSGPRTKTKYNWQHKIHEVV